MHDPNTLAFEIKRPWPTPMKSTLGGKPWRFYPAIVSVWHRDPEKGGDDDSCGWSFPHLTAEEIADAQKIGRQECEMEFAGLLEAFESPGGEVYRSKRDPMATVLEVFALVSWRVWHKRLKARELPHILALATSNTDGFYDTFAEARPKAEIERAFVFIARCLKQMRRPWWRHPRFHFWHWRITIGPLRDFKRWAFSRCAGCGKRFRWGYAPISMSWNGTGPRWFCGEAHVYHDGCDPPLRQPRKPSSSTPEDPR